MIVNKCCVCKKEDGPDGWTSPKPSGKKILFVNTCCPACEVIFRQKTTIIVRRAKACLVS